MFTLEGSGVYIRRLVRCVTIEPVIFICLFGVGLESTTQAAFLYYKACLTRFRDSHICQHIQNKTIGIEDIVQTDTSHWTLYKSIAHDIPSVILVFLYGTVSDHFSRKWAIAIPIIGHILGSTCDLIQSLFMELHVGFVLLSALIKSLFGGNTTLFMAFFSYYGTISSDTNRTLYISIGEGVVSAAFCLALFISGILLDHTSFHFIFATIIILQIISFAYLVLLVKEPPKYSPKEEKGRNTGFLRRGWMSIPHVCDAYLCIFKKRSMNRRCQLLVVLSCVIFITIAAGRTYLIFALHQQSSVILNHKGWNYSLKHVLQYIFLHRGS